MRLGTRARAVAIACIVSAVVGCGSPTPTPTTRADASPSAGSSAEAVASARPTGIVGESAPADCPPVVAIPCEVQDLHLAMEIPGTGLALTWASERLGPGRTSASVSWLGLGGWGVNDLAAYLPDARRVIDGDGEPHDVAAVETGSGDVRRLLVMRADGSGLLEFDTRGRHLRTLDPLSGAVLRSFSWDADGLRSVNDRAGRLLTVVRSADGSVVDLVSRRGLHLSLKIADGRLQTAFGPDGSATWIETDGDGRVTALTDPDGRRSFEYGDGRVRRVTYADGAVVSIVRKIAADGTVTVTATTDGGRTTTYASAPRPDGFVRSVTGPDATVTSETLTATRRVIVLPDGTTITRSLTDDGRWGSQWPTIDQRIDSDAGSWTTTEARAWADTTPSSSASDGTVVWRTPTGDWNVVIDAGARRLTQTRPSGRTDQWILDGSGRLTSAAIAGQPLEQIGYDAFGGIRTWTIGEGSTARSWTIAPDVTHAAVAVVDPAGGRSVRRFGPSGLVEEIDDPGRAALAIDHDPAGRVVSTRRAGGASLVVTRRPDGQPWSQAASGGGGLVTLAYDVDGALAGMNSPVGSTSLERDAADRITTLRAGDTTTAFVYDDAGHVESAETDGVALTLRRLGPVPVGLAWSGAIEGTLEEALDPTGRVASLQITGASPMTFSYGRDGLADQVGGASFERDAAGRVTRQTVGVVSIDRTYDSFGRLIGIQANGGATRYSSEIGRDPDGRVIRTDQTTDGDTRTTTYRHDPSGFLIGVTGDGHSVVWTYDVDGRRRTSTIDGTKTNASYSPDGRLLRIGGRTLAWDQAGRLTALRSGASRTTFRYDTAGQLQGETLPDGRQVDLLVDGRGQRVGRVVDGNLVGGALFDLAGRLVATLDAKGAIDATFGYLPEGDTPVLMRRSGRDFAIVTDHLGSPRLVLDAATGQVAQAIDYDPWGKIIRDTAPGFQPFGFAGGIVDPDTGLVRFGVRDYDPTTGRWTTPDPLGIEQIEPDLYGYVTDPVTARDPSGRCVFCPTVITGGVSGQVGFGVNVGGGVSVAIGPDGVAVNVSYGGGLGTGKGPSTQGTVGFQRPVDGGPVSIKDFQTGSNGSNVDFGFGPVVVGREFSVDENGKPTYEGWHIGPQSNGWGPSVGVQRTPVNWGFCLGPGCKRTVDPEPPPKCRDIQCWDDDPPPPPPVCDPGGPAVGCVPNQCAEELSCTQDPADPAGECATSDDGSACLKPPDPCAGADAPIPCATKDPTDPGHGPGSHGDPHLTTASGTRFDFQGAGEYVMLRTDDRRFEVQARLQPYGGASSSVSATTALAMSVAGSRLTVTRRPGTMLADVRIDGVPIDLRTSHRVGVDGRVRGAAGGLIVTWPDGTTLTAAIDYAGIDYLISLGPARAADVHGLLGPSAPDGGGQLEGADGRRYAVTGIDRATLYDQVGRSWMVADADTLFDYRAGDGPKDFRVKGFPAAGPAPTPEALALAASICDAHGVSTDARDACVFDVALTGDPSFAAAVRRLAITTANVAGQAPDAPFVTPIAPGQRIDGVVSSSAPEARYTFAGSAGDVIYLDSNGPRSDTVFWTLEAPDGTDLNGTTYSSDDIGRRVLSMRGTYTVVVRQDGAPGGTFSFVVRPVPKTSERSIATGDVVTGSFRTPGDEAKYTFAAAAGDVVYLDATGPRVEQGFWVLESPDGSSLNGSTYSSDDIGRRVLAKAGTYTVRLFNDGLATGAYGFRLLAVPRTTKTAITQGQTVSGTFRSPGDEQRFTFDAHAGDVIHLDGMGERLPQGFWTLLDPDGIALNGTTYSSDDIGPRALEKTGTYTIVVFDEGIETGTFRFRLSDAS